MEPHRHDAAVAQVLAWLKQADQSRGSRKPVLAVGRDGLMLPIRGEACYREGATATVSVYDRRGQRLGTVYLGRMPEPGQETLSQQLTALLEEVLRRWTGPLPRLAYITDGGYQQTRYYRQVLRRMSNPRHPAAAEVGMGDRLLSCVRIHLQDGRCVVLRPQASPSLGAEDVPLAENEAEGDLPGVALGGGNPAAADRGGCEAEAIPQRLQLLAEADSFSGLLPIPSGSPADRQRGDRSGVQDGVHPTAETVRDDLETGRRSMDRRPARDPIERPLVSGVSSILASEDASRNGDSAEELGKKKTQKAA